MKAWEKSVERHICKILGAIRKPCTGRQELDGEHDWLAIEIKGRSSIPKWMVKGMAQAEAGRPKLPVLVIHEKGTDYLDAHISMRLRDFVDWFNPNPKGDAKKLLSPTFPLPGYRMTASAVVERKADG